MLCTSVSISSRSPTFVWIFRWVMILVLVTSSRVHAVENATTLIVGESYEVPFMPGDQVVVTDGTVVATRILGDRVVIVGRKQGLSVVTVGGTSYTFSVITSADLKDLQSAVKDILAGVEGVDVRLIGSRLILTGTALNSDDLNQVEKVARSLGILSTVSLDPRAHYPAPLIHISFHFAEVNEDLLQQLGIAWGNGVLTTVLDGLTIANGVVSLQESQSGNLTMSPLVRETADVALDASESAALLRVHDVHEVVVMNGHTDEYRYGGQIFVSVANGLTTALEQVDFGTFLKVTPRLDTQGQILLDVQYEVSAVAPNPSAGTFQLDRRSQTTTVLLQEGQVLALAGVTRNESGKSHLGLPWLARIPVLGFLFASHTTERSMIDGVIFIQASRYEPNPKKEEARRRSVVQDLGELPIDHPSAGDGIHDDRASEYREGY